MASKTGKKPKFVMCDIRHMAALWHLKQHDKNSALDAIKKQRALVTYTPENSFYNWQNQKV